MTDLENMLKQTNERFPGGFGYWTALYKKGRPYSVEQFSTAERQELRAICRRYSSRIGMCYMNAQTLALRSKDLKYIEGLVTVHSIPINHAWLTFNNKLFDPTLIDLKAFKDKQGLVREYFGIEIDKQLIYKNQLATEEYGPISEWPSPFAAQVLGLKGEK